MKISLLSLAVVATTIASSRAQGVNCEGSTFCARATSDQAPLLVSLINRIPDVDFYANGKLIACGNKVFVPFDSPGAICAFLQNSGGLGAGDIKPLAAEIIAHGCTSCGSAEFTTGTNGVFGLLTFNFVASPSCVNGICA
ncbi:killer toxin [Mycena latifolia]|nr:killer toxin [Mycena latifolia]